MKGNFFVKPLEYKLDINGESWHQGDLVTGKLVINNHGGDDVDMSKLGCHLCFCQRKKLKAKDEKAITVIESARLAPGQNELSFSFQLAPDCPVTETAGSLYIICGDIDKPYEAGMLELNVTPIKIITNFVDVFEQFFRFKLKAYKNKKNLIEAAVTPPDSKEWATIQKMSLQLRMDNDELMVNFIFSIKKIVYDNSVTSTKNEKREISKTLTKKDYGLYGATNQDGIRKVITEVLAEVKLKPVI